MKIIRYGVNVSLIFFFFQAEDGIRDSDRDWSSDVCSSDLADHVRDFRDDNPHAIVARLLVFRLRADPNQATSDAVGIGDPFGTVEDAAGRKVRAANRTRLRVVQVD